MKDTIDKIKEKYKEIRVEIVLMIVFVFAFLVLNVPEIVQEVSVSHAVTDSKDPEYEDQGGDLAGGEPESSDQTEGLSESEGAGEPEEEGEPDTGQEKEAGSESEIGAETELETETESEAQTEALSAEELGRRLRKALAAMPEDFVIPMEMPQQDEAGRLPVFGLKDSKELHGYHLLIPQELWEKHEAEKPLSLLKAMVENRISKYDGTWSVYVKKLAAGDSFVVNDRPMKSASVMKLFIMGAVYKSFESGLLERTDEVMSLMENMITVSDNEASNQLLYLLGDSSYERGIEVVNEFIQEYGFSDMTVEYNGFNNSATNTGSGNYNQVSAKDCGKLLEDIYRRAWVNRAVGNEMEDMLLNQHTRYKIPAGLPEGVLCGNKTGEMDTTENDAAIIFSKNGDYILVVLSSDWNSKDEAISRIKSMSAMVYEFLN